MREHRVARDAENAREEQLRVGLCANCQYMERIRSDRGAVFYRCGRAASDPTFRKYPALPVMLCAGYEVKKSADT